MQERFDSYTQSGLIRNEHLIKKPGKSSLTWLLVGLFFINIYSVNGINIFDGNVHHEGQNLSYSISIKDITPSTKVLNWVNGEPYKEIHDSLYVKVLAIRDESKTALIITMDLVYVGESLSRRFREALGSEFGIESDFILFNGSHNHSAPFPPVYDEDMRNIERDTAWNYLAETAEAEKTLEYREWKMKVFNQTLSATREALSTLKSCELQIGKADISQVVRNRRPRKTFMKYEVSKTTKNYNYRHENWDPSVISGNTNFGPVDRAMNVLFFEEKESDQRSVVYNMAAHAVSIYPYFTGISADWPGKVSESITKEFKGNSMFLQGAAGDISPWRRGEAAVNEMANQITDLVKRCYKHSAEVFTKPINAGIIKVKVPLKDYGKTRMGLSTLELEIQVISIGTLAIVALPGEPMTEIGLEIKRNSPFSHTLVLGYSNGVGTCYYGMPGEEKFGGYETEDINGLGTDDAGLVVVNAAIKLLDLLESENRSYLYD